jgi:hypothetical protein
LEDNAELATGQPDDLYASSLALHSLVFNHGHRLPPLPYQSNSHSILLHSDQFEPLCCPHDSVSTSQTTLSQDRPLRYQQHEQQHPIDICPSTVFFRGLQQYPLLAPRTIRRRSRMFRLDHPSRPAALSSPTLPDLWP